MIYVIIIELANTKHACRGAALTLAIYKILHPEQDIRSHKAEYENGFSARGVDHSVTVPFLIQKGLPYNVDTHWLSQTLSYSQPYMPDVVLKTVPKKVGPDFIITVNLIQNSVSNERVKKITILILEKMIEERNKGNIPLTKPKNLSILYEIVSSRTVFKKRLIEEYKIFTDFYIKEAIIFVLSKVKYNDVDILKFFEKLIKEERNLSAKSIKRIAEYFGDEYGYIRWNRENLYGFKQDAIISDFIDDLLLTVDLMNKEFLPFRYWGKDHIDMHTKFLKNDKHIIGDINNYLEQKYQCVRTGDCNGSVAFERRIMAEISPKADIETLDMNSFFESYEVIIKKLFNHYQVTNKKTERHMREEDFHDSVYMKCVDIATGLYYGSLMCNYYTNQFATYNNNQRNIGYEVYDPLEYGEEVALTSPVPTYQDFVERLGEYIIKNIEVPDAKDLIWAKNVKLTRKNVLNLLKPLEIKHNEWVMLAGRISLHEDDKYETKWRDR